MSLETTLQSFSALDGFTKNDFRLLSTFIEERTFKDGETIIGEKGDSRTLYFVFSGKVRIHRELGKGKVIFQHVLGPKEMFGEVAFADGEGRTANASAEGATVLGCFEFEHFDVIKKQDPVFGMKFLMQVTKTLAKKFRQLNTGIERIFRPSSD